MMYIMGVGTAAMSAFECFGARVASSCILNMESPRGSPLRSYTW
jgi:hypothetical protein